MIQDHSIDFDMTAGQIWLNAASEGPLPKVSAKALHEAIYWKSSPERLTIQKFIEIPLLLKKSIAALINASADDVILGNSATYGMHLLSHGLPLTDGDEVLLMQNDFPTDILPWLFLKQRGVHVLQLPSSGQVVSPEEVLQAITSKTKAVCLPMVHSFSGWPVDIPAIGKLCQDRGIIVVVNISQTAGVYPVDLTVLPVDAVVCAGYKWLVGPYGTGFCWIKPSIRQSLTYDQAYWIAQLDEQTMNAQGELSYTKKESARSYDVFGTANFFNYVPWRASIDYIQSKGIEQVRDHSRFLLKKLQQGLDQRYYGFISPSVDTHPTPIAVVTHQDSSRNKEIVNMLKEKGIHVAFWRNSIRISPHLYNSVNHVDVLIEVLNRGGR